MLNFKAKRESRCVYPDCSNGGVINIGEPMTWNRRKGSGQTYHVACYNLLMGTKTLNDETEERELKAFTPINATEHSSPTKATSAIDALAEVLIEPLRQRLESKVDESAVISLIEQYAPLAQTLDEAKVRELIAASQVQRIEVHNVTTDVTTDLGLQHMQFPLLLQVATSRLADGYHPNVWLSGPAGSFKTHSAMALAKALNVPFYFCGALMEPYALLGFKNAMGEYQSTQFRQAYASPSVFLFDEYDSSDPVAVMPFNAATANGHCAFPDGVIERHRDCIIIAAANTWGHGATNEYVGRMKQDGAMLDRFVKLPWAYDEKLERTLADNDAWTTRVQTVRRNVAAKGIKVLVTPRASLYGSALLRSGLAWDTVETLCLQNGMTAEQWQSVR